MIPGSAPNLNLAASNETKSSAGNTGAVISGGQTNGLPWWVWLAAGGVVIVWLFKR